MLAPKSHKALSIFKLPIVQGTEKLPGSINLGRNFLKITTEHTSLRPIVAKSTNFPLFERIYFKYLDYFDI